MRLVATVNGRKVFSDLEIRSVVNSKIIFSDGSTCNTQTGEIKIVGTGYISLDVPPENIEDTSLPMTWGPERFSASCVNISGVDANVKIEVHDSDFTTVEMTGSKSAIEGIAVVPKEATLSIKGKKKSRSVDISFGGNVTITSSRVVASEENQEQDLYQPSNRFFLFLYNVIVCGWLSILTSFARLFGAPDSDVSVLKIKQTKRGGSSSESIMIVGGAEENVDILIKVPKFISLALKKINGKIDVGDTEGDVDLTVSENHRATFGKIGNAVLANTGTKKIQIEAVKGTLLALSSYTGGFEIISGEVSNLSAELTGSGSFRFGGRAAEAHLQVNYTGSIFLNQVDGPVYAQTDGSGHIKIDHGVVTELDAKVTYTGGVTVQSVNGPMKVTSSGSGKVRIAEGSTPHLEAKLTYTGGIFFGGCAQTAELFSSGSGNIEVAHVVSQPVQKATYTGKIVVHSIG